MATSLFGPSASSPVTRSDAVVFAGIAALLGLAVGWAFAAPAVEVDIIAIGPPVPTQGCGCGS